MNTSDILAVVRQKIGQAVDEIDCNSPTYPDSFLLSYVNTTNLILTSLGVQTNVVVSGTTIVPDATVQIGLLLAFGAAASLIKSDLLKRLRNGELGLSFSSGATSISTNIASGQLKAIADEIKDSFEVLLTSYLSGDPNSVLGRDI